MYDEPATSCEITTCGVSIGADVILGKACIDGRRRVVTEWPEGVQAAGHRGNSRSSFHNPKVDRSSG